MTETRYQSEDPRQIDIEEAIAERGGRPYTPGPRQAAAFTKEGLSVEEMHKKVERDYDTLKCVLDLAFFQAAYGKGQERHADGKPFDKQPLMEIAKTHGLGFLTGQAAKKMQEAHGMVRREHLSEAKAEIIGAIVYLAAAHIHIDALQKGALKCGIDLPDTMG